MVDPQRQPDVERELEQTLLARVADADGRRSWIGTRRTRARNGHDAPLATLARELVRSRRYRRPLALIGIAPSSSARNAAVDAAAAIRPLVRAVDHVWASPTRAFVLLPESDRRDVDGLLRRLKEQANGALAEARADVAVFPIDGLTALALLEIANGRMEPALVEPPASFFAEAGPHAVNGSHPAAADGLAQ